MIAIGPEECRSFPRAIAREWLETNGLGGYASSTIVGANTRRYHGLLIAALQPPGRRTVLLSKLEETLAVGDVEYDLSCNQYPGAVHPQGYLHQEQFRLDPFPTFVYEVGSAPATRLEKAVAMPHGLNAVVVRYRLLAGSGTTSLILRPLATCRDHHHLMRQHPGFDTAAELGGARDLVAMRPYRSGPTLYLWCPQAYFEVWGDWYYNFEYPAEAARGLDSHEDLYSPGFFTCDLEAGESRYLVASVDPPRDWDPEGLLEAERHRREQLLSGWEHACEQIRLLVRAADDFIVARAPATGQPGSHGIIAGYPWFEEWGRDAMISLPGLTLATGRPELARSVLQTFAGYVSQGMVPNRIPAVDQPPDYNSVDAALWMFWAVHKYFEYTADAALVRRELLPALQEIVAWHVRGTRYGVEMDADGLLRAGEPGQQLTWMDAKVGDWVVTPRHGKPVEVNALWHHALRFLEEMEVSHPGPPSEVVARQFRQRFWNPEVGYLNDVVDGEGLADSSLRPNQVIAVSLPYPLLPLAQARQVVAAVQRDLLTPYGLRTLSPRDPRYQGRYGVHQVARDGAYHQGTVWPWLLGPFISAFLRVSSDRQAACERARRWLQPLWGHLREAGLGTVSEVFDGDPPHQPGGCIAQAWSVAELLRVAIEDLGYR